MARELLVQLPEALTLPVHQDATAVRSRPGRPARCPGDATTGLRVSSDPVARKVTLALLAAPADQRTLDQWAAELYVSERTVRHAFVAKTRMSFAAWRTAVRGRAAPAAGRSSGRAGRRTGRLRERHRVSGRLPPPVQ
jgi:methylphosphotriester-DNA--protein-cysteine methyltransferase